MFLTENTVTPMRTFILLEKENLKSGVFCTIGSYTLAVSVAVLSVASFLIYPSSGVSHDILTTICSKTQNHDACKRSLESDSRTRSADLPKLALISIELTMKHADHNHQTFSELRGNATNPRLEDSFRNCVGFYKEMQAQIRAAYHLSQKREYKKITELVQSERLAQKCASGVPINCLEIDALTTTMLLAIKTAESVNQYIANSFA